VHVCVVKRRPAVCRADVAVLITDSLLIIDVLFLLISMSTLHQDSVKTDPSLPSGLLSLGTVKTPCTRCTCLFTFDWLA